MSKKMIGSKLALEFANFPYLSPQFVRAINLEITEALRDCNNRPTLKKPRKLKMELIFTPHIDAESDDKECFDVDVDFNVSPVSRPHRKAEGSRISLNKQHQGYFHADFPDEPNASGLFDEQKVEPPKPAKAK